MSPLSIFVAGAGGFIGRAIASHLEALGHRVTRHERSCDGDLAPGAIPPGADLVVNAAGRLGARGVTPDRLRADNLGTAILLGSWCARQGRPLIHLSTPGVTGLVAEATEDLPPAPWGPYERAKADAEASLAGLLAAGSLTILRPDFVYGPGDRHKLAFFRQVRRGWFPLVGGGLARLRPTYVHDVARAVAASLPGSPLSGGLFNAGGPEVVTVGGLARRTARAMDRRLVLLPVPPALLRAALGLGPLCPPALSPSRLALFGRDHFVDASKAGRAGFLPETGLDTGLALTVADYRDRGWLG